MKYAIKAHPTKYSGVMFRSRLEARWAAFFNVMGWEWKYEPVDLIGWSPDFYIEFPCGHSECGGKHRLLVEVKPHSSVSQFEEHECLKYPYGMRRGVRGDDDVYVIDADSSAAFGADPRVTWFELVHGHGSGEGSLDEWFETRDLMAAWKEAGNIVQWRVKRQY